MTLEEVHVGDPVTVVGEPGLWRVDAKTDKGILTLECLNVTNRMVLTDIHEFQALKAGAFV